MHQILNLSILDKYFYTKKSSDLQIQSIVNTMKSLIKVVAETNVA